MTQDQSLLEVSPWREDGGEMIGRDPRKVDWQGVEPMPLLKVIRAKCLDCCIDQAQEIRKCTATDCALWPYRMGTNPLRKKSRLTDERRREMAERAKTLGRGK